MDEPLIAALRDKVAAKATHAMIGSFVERDGDRLYNTSLALVPMAGSSPNTERAISSAFNRGRSSCSLPSYRQILKKIMKDFRAAKTVLTA